MKQILTEFIPTCDWSSSFRWCAVDASAISGNHTELIHLSLSKRRNCEAVLGDSSVVTLQPLHIFRVFIFIECLAFNNVSHNLAATIIEWSRPLDGNRRSCDVVDFWFTRRICGWNGIWILSEIMVHTTTDQLCIIHIIHGHSPTGFRASTGLDASLALLRPAMFMAYTLNWYSRPSMRLDTL